MVVLTLLLQCGSCKKQMTINNESGEFNGEVGKFECEHFSGSIILETKIGWLLGTNAEVCYHLYMRCHRCNEENIKTIKASGLSSKSDFVNVQFCHAPHYLHAEYSQDSIASGAVNFANNIFGIFGW